MEPLHPVSGFEEIPHTADWAVRVWAPDLPGFFIEAARGMNTLSGAKPAGGPKIQRVLILEGADPESLLVAFLSELVYALEQDRIVFLEFKISLGSRAPAENLRLRAEMSGRRLSSVAKAIKAVTYHNLQILCTEKGCTGEIVFDV